jgi:hypothetical protein
MELKQARTKICRSEASYSRLKRLRREADKSVQYGVEVKNG